MTLAVPDALGAPERRAVSVVGRGRWAERADEVADVLAARPGAAGAVSSLVPSAPFALVAIETATETVGVAVRTPAGVQAEFALTGRRRHVETLTPAVEHLLAQVGLTPSDLGVVAVDVGPGLFTGLRVGVAAAKGLAQSLGIGVVGATSLDILTAGAAAAGHRGLVLACVDARRAEVFAAVREVGDAGEVVAEPIAPALFAPVDLAVALDGLGGAAVLAVGDGAERYRAVLEPVPGVRATAPALAFPPPAALLGLALGAHRGGRIASRRRVASFPSTCVRRTQRATSHVRSGPEPGVVVTLRIEKLRRRDLRQLLRIESRVFPEPWSPEVFNSELALRKGRLYRAAWDGDEMAGYIGFMIVDDEAHMTTIATAPAYQRTGVATTMIVDGIRTLRAGGVKHISLEVAANNEPAQALYRRFGFAPVGVRKNYYPVTGQDALVMWVYDIDSESYAERLDHLAATGVAVEEGRSR